MAREMAMQMLFQSDLGSTPLPLVVASFDPVEYLSQLARDRADVASEEAAAEESADGEPKKIAAKPKSLARRKSATSGSGSAPDEPEENVRDAFAYARRLAEGVYSHLETIDGRIRAQA